MQYDIDIPDDDPEPLRIVLLNVIGRFFPSHRLERVVRG